ISSRANPCSSWEHLLFHLLSIKTQTRRQRVGSRPESVLVFQVGAELATLRRVIESNDFLLLQLMDKFWSCLRYDVPSRTGRSRLDQDFIVQPHASAAPVTRFDERVTLHEFVDQLLRLVLGDGTPPRQLAFLFGRFDHFGIRKR